MEQPFFRQKSVDRISSPEQLGDYLRVTTPALWIVLAAVILLLAGLFIWSSVTAVESYAAGTVEARNGVLTMTFADEAAAQNVKVGMNVKVGDLVTPVLSVGQDDDGRILAIANANMPDGCYEASVGYRSTQLIEMLFH